jgi:ABC-type antimicrobial peptide transport system permease subunit
VIHGEVKSGPRPWLYLPVAQHHQSQVQLHVAADDSGAMRSALQSAVHALDADLPDIALKNLDSVLSDIFFEQRLMAWNSGIFGLIALLLSTLGVYAVIAYSVSQRTHEYGIRLALGATAPDIARHVLRQAAVVILVGVPIGVAMYLAGGQVVRAYLLGVSSTDPRAIGAAVLLIASVTLLAAYVPARRATRVDPVTALRYE